jgi:hypothetical protein
MERCLSAEPALREIAPGRRKACHLDRLHPAPEHFCGKWTSVFR